MENRKKFQKIALPGWLFAAGMVVYNELMLHLWITEDVSFWRLAAVAAFALGCGCVLALATALLPTERSGKIAAITLSVLVTVIWLTMYFVSDAYQVFMHPKTIIGGAGGVAEDYMDLIVSLLLRNLWRIGLMLLPILLYGLFCRCPKSGWKIRMHMAVMATYFYLLGIVVSQGPAGDAARFKEAYNFDSAVRCMGLNMALILEASGASVPDEEPAFIMTPTAPKETMPAAPQPEQETLPEEEPEVVYGDQIYEGIDFGDLAQQEGAAAIKSLYQYLDSLTPAKKNAYTGMFEGKNLILISAEAFTAEAIDPELTPTLYRMANQGILFKEYYQPAWGASTTSGEFSNLMGIVPTTGGMCMKEVRQQDMFLTIGNQLNDLGYHSVAYHNHNYDFYDRHKTHIEFGYDTFLAQFGGLEGITPEFPESDLEMIDISVPQYIDKQPFSIYYMTVSGHSVYTQKGHAQARKNFDKVAHLDCSEKVKCYLAAQLELEFAMESLLNQLEEAGIMDDTVIVMATDHYPYGLERSGTWNNNVDYLSELFGVDKCDKFIRDHSQLIIWSGCLEGQNIVVEDPVYSLDILPTISNLFGVEYDSRLLVGRDVFSDEEPIVLWPEHSWVTDKGTYDVSTRTFIPREGVTVEEGYVERISALVSNKITYSNSVLNHNFFNYLVEHVKPAEAE